MISDFLDNKGVEFMLHLSSKNKKKHSHPKYYKRKFFKNIYIYTKEKVNGIQIKIFINI